MDEILHLKMGYATLEMKNKSRFILCFSLFIVTLHTEIRILFILPKIRNYHPIHD